MIESLEREIEGLRSLFRSERDPDGRAFVPLADAYRRGQELEHALELVSEGLERHPDLASAHVVAAWIHRDRGDRAAARAEWLRVLELDEENVEALRGLGTLLLESGRMDEARPYLEKVRLLDPDEPEEEAAAPLAGEPAEAAPSVEPSFDFAVASEGELEQAEAPPEIEALHGTEGIAKLQVLLEEETLEQVKALSEPEATQVEGPSETEVPELEPAAQPEGQIDLGPTHPEGEIDSEPSPPMAALPEVQASPASELTESQTPVSDDVPLVLAAGAEALLGASEITEVWSEAPAEEEAEAPQIPPTRTLAELFARQGLHARAADIYERLLEERPEDAALRERLEELRSREGKQPAAGVHAEDTEVLAREMSALGPTPEAEASPFGWVVEEPSEEAAQAGGETVQDYFRRLLGWVHSGEVAEIATLPAMEWSGGDAEPEAAFAEPTIAAEIEGHEPVALEEAVPLQEAVAFQEPMAPEQAGMVPIESLAPDGIVPIESLAPGPVVPVASLAPDSVPIESLAPDGWASPGGSPSSF